MKETPMFRPFALSLAFALAACGGDVPQPSDAPAGPASEQASTATGDASAPDLKLYALDCGRIEMLDLGIFSIEGAYEGEQNSAIDTCFLIRHPKGDLVWDAGLPDSLAQMEDGLTNGPFKVSVPTTLLSQLEALEVPPADVEYFSISHSHFDHTGNANYFAGSTFIVHEAEREWMFAQDDTSAFTELADAETVTFSDVHDVFGDGSVTIHPMPGHTPGHSVLLVRLENEGPVLLTGDMYHLDRARELKTVPRFNTDIDQTRRSIEAFEALAAETGARVIIQHEADDFAELPKPPAYLD